MGIPIKLIYHHLQMEKNEMEIHEALETSRCWDHSNTKFGNTGFISDHWQQQPSLELDADHQRWRNQRWLGVADGGAAPTRPQRRCRFSTQRVVFRSRRCTRYQEKQYTQLRRFAQAVRLRAAPSESHAPLAVGQVSQYICCKEAHLFPVLFCFFKYSTVPIGTNYTNNTGII